MYTSKRGKERPYVIEAAQIGTILKPQSFGTELKEIVLYWMEGEVDRQGLSIYLFTLRKFDVREGKGLGFIWQSIYLKYYRNLGRTATASAVLGLG